MPDPATLAFASVANFALTEGVKFLYAQAGDLLKWWRDRKSAKRDDEKAESSAEVALRVEAPRAIEGGSFEARPDTAALERLENELRALRGDLLEYVEGVDAGDRTDPAFLGRVDGLRRALEVIYQHPLTFAGEVRAKSGPSVDVDIDADSVAGYITGVRAKHIAGGSVTSKMRFGRAESGANITGVDVDVIGGRRDP
jgi:hypothetical protein